MRRIFLLVIAIACMCILAGTATAAPEQWTTALGGNGHWYEAVASGNDRSWTAANIAVSGRTYSGLTGHLATITSESENSYVFALVSDNCFWTYSGLNYRVFGP